MPDESKTVFVRKASGLTRVISKWDALAYSFVAPTIAYAAHYIIWAQTFNPGADMYIASLWILSLMPVAGLYVLFSVSMPRSGGEYIYVSRIISPAWGLFSCWTLTIVGLNWSGVLTSWLVNWGIGDTLLAQGILAGDTPGTGGLVDLGLFLNNPATLEAWLIGTIALLFCYVLMARGTKTVVRFTWFIFVFNFIGLAVYAVALLPSDFTATQARILAITGHSYSDIITGANAAATALGQTFPAGSTALLPTLMAGATYLNLSTLGSTFSANIAGEIKEVKSAQALAQLGSLVMFVFYWEVFVAIQYAGFGVEWYQAIAMFDQANAAGVAAPGTAGWLGYYFGFDVANKLPLATYNVIFATGSPVLVGLSTIHFAIIDFGGMLTLAFGPVRNLFAWSFDGILPRFVNKVNRRGSPVGAVALGGIIAWLINTINVFTTWLVYIIHTIAIWMIGWCVFSIAGIVFPWRRKDIFEKSPGVVQRKLAGIPLVSILGCVSLGVSAWGVYSALAPPLTALFTGGGGMEMILGTVAFFVIIPFILYYAAYFINKSKGIPMDLRFKEIPPD